MDDSIEHLPFSRHHSPGWSLIPLRSSGLLAAPLYVLFPALLSSANTPSASQLIISTCFSNSIRPFFSFCYVRSAAEIIFGGCSNLQHSVNIFCRKPSSLRLSDKLTEAIDNSFDSKLQLSVAQRALLAGVCCDKHPRCSSPDRDFCRPR